MGGHFGGKNEPILASCPFLSEKMQVCSSGPWKFENLSEILKQPATANVI